MKITTIFPTVRDDDKARKALKSIKNQTLRSHELIMDGGGPTAGAAINRAIDVATGDLITWCYDDDILMEERNQIFSLYAQKYPDVDVFYGGGIYINETGKMLYLWYPPVIDDESLEFGCVPSTLLSAVRRTAVGDIRFREDYPICDEFVFFYNLYQKGCKFMRIHIPLAFIRVWDGQNTLRKHEAKVAEHKRIQQEYGEKIYSKCKYRDEFYEIKNN